MKRVVKSGRWLVPAGLCALVAFVSGCDLSPTAEEEFVLTGVLSQATADTTTTDHLSPAVSPDGTRILFLTDAYAAEKGGTNAFDFALVNMPGPGVIPPLVDNVNKNDGWLQIELGKIPDDSGTLFSALESVKGEASWMPDSQGFVAVVSNPSNNERLYRFVLEAVPANGKLRVSDAQLIDDVGFASLGNRRSYHYLTPAVSPDGQWVAYARYYFAAGSAAAGTKDDVEYMAIYAYNFASGEVVRVTNGSTLEQDPSWSPDGTQIVFTSQAGEVGTRELMIVPFDPQRVVAEREWIAWEDGGNFEPFTDGRRRITTTSGQSDWKLPVGSFNPTWMRDGRIVFTSTRRAEGVSVRVRNIWYTRSDGAEPVLAFFTRSDDDMASTANYTNASSDAASLIVFSTRSNRSVDFADQKQDLWVLRDF